MVTVTQESLAEKIKRLESRGNAEYALGLTLNEEYQLAAYRMLLKYLASPVEVNLEKGNG
ncbi:TPA: hypothetical protein ACG0NL_000102 [Enterobacter hormaechei subsp. steigerwaltii]|uniref:hypothetical protein n=1 Tax=Enterobacter hormaechei TaxID=158836 RepID=UPI000B50E51B|nr:hypothetical protein [Enterobacter hormaechei]OWS89947.1 hypothetical protein CEQ53_15090 [Enterobacter hormaechei]QDQ77944.1 hypothetical protein FO617_16590 [Enterobacter hormaechei subsp. steigerwaltii]RAY61480.1 hypothetical protein DP186_03120 [Enterobacter hormaechei subsp. xiangfangensis]HAV1653964.1 hypothetical protein [Enterobacter hormaechei subsp. steigerwaltii]HAV1745544.1 hypothetical protein [Enterobacter hormaechei subsp. xiangfangensis]